MDDRSPAGARLQSQIEAALDTRDRVICNLRITLAHYELSLALRDVTGPDSGANFHTWAVWGSRQAGQTIREQDVPWLRSAARGVAAVAGAGAGAGFTPGTATRKAAGSAVGAIAATVALGHLTTELLERSATQILGGNVTVVSDIGRQTARFVGAFVRPEDRTEERLERFLAGLRPGAAADGGQELLHGAYRHYFDASREADADRRDELMLCANLLAILHEHQRLEPYLRNALPHPFRRLVTEHILGFTAGAQAMRVAQDIPARGSSTFPETLRTIELPELASLLSGPHGWDATPDTATGSAARDWTRLSDRMNFIVDLFRTRQCDPDLFVDPYSPSQRDEIIAGRVPAGRL